MMSETPAFEPFAKIARLNRETIVTEKIDGTNASVHVLDDGSVLAASRTRWITPIDDNHGFARWVHEHEEELRVGLGPGAHYGEWWGQGIQRRYGLTEKRFSLFNVARWTDDAVRPACCHVVPTLGTLDSLDGGPPLADILDSLYKNGSAAAPGFKRPEGVVLYHTASGQLFKVTLEDDSSPKSLAACAPNQLLSCVCKRGTKCCPVEHT